jgi:putative transposase
MKRLSQLAYKQTAKYDVVHYYRLCAISRAAGILSARKKSLKRGIKTKNPYTAKPQLISCYGFKITNGVLRVPLGNRQYFDVLLNKHTQHVLSSDPKLVVRSFTLTTSTVSIAFSKVVAEIECSTAAGIDRNLRNVTYGNCNKVVHYDLTKAVEIVETSNDVVKSFKRNDARVRKKLASKYGKRRKNRINQMLHRVSKAITHQAAEDKQAPCSKTLGTYADCIKKAMVKEGTIVE